MWSTADLVYGIPASLNWNWLQSHGFNMDEYEDFSREEVFQKLLENWNKKQNIAKTDSFLTFFSHSYSRGECLWILALEKPSFQSSQGSTTLVDPNLLQVDAEQVKYMMAFAKSVGIGLEETPGWHLCSSYS